MPPDKNGNQDYVAGKPEVSDVEVRMPKAVIFSGIIIKAFSLVIFGFAVFSIWEIYEGGVMLGGCVIPPLIFAFGVYSYKLGEELKNGKKKTVFWLCVHFFFWFSLGVIGAIAGSLMMASIYLGVSLIFYLPSIALCFANWKYFR
jgi:hypothetical protein